MTYIGKTTLALALVVGAFGATSALAGNGDMDQTKLQLKDGSCQDTVVTLSATSPDAIKDQIRLQLKDGSCQDTTVTVQSAPTAVNK